MRARKFMRLTISVLRIAAVAWCLSLFVFAQTPSPTPSPAPAGPAGSSLPQFFDNLIGRAGALIPMLQNEIEGRLLPWLENLSWWLAVLVIIFGFARLWRENAGAGADLFWWFARLGVIFALMGSGPKIIDGMFVMGREIAVGEDGQGALFQLYVKQRGNFDAAYRVFQEGLFTVKYVPVQPTPGGVLGHLGVLFSAESSA